jgi:hypothetical protein
MNDAGTLPVHMLDIRELTAEAFSPCGQVIAPLRTGSQGAEISYDRRALSQKRFRARGPAGYASGMDQLSYRRHRFPPPIHPARDLAVSPVHPELPRRGGAPG